MTDIRDTETGDITGTADKDYNIIWFTEQCLNNVLRLETYITDAERAGDHDLAEFFRKAQARSRRGAEQGKQLLAAASVHSRLHESASRPRSRRWPESAFGPRRPPAPSTAACSLVQATAEVVAPIPGCPRLDEGRSAHLRCGPMRHFGNEQGLRVRDA